MKTWTRYAPTYKWWAATVTGLGTIAGAAWTGDGINTDDEKLLVIGIIVQRVVAYAAGNKTA